MTVFEIAKTPGQRMGIIFFCLGVALLIFSTLVWNLTEAPFAYQAEVWQEVYVQDLPKREGYRWEMSGDHLHTEFKEMDEKCMRMEDKASEERKRKHKNEEKSPSNIDYTFGAYLLPNYDSCVTGSTPRWKFSHSEWKYSFREFARESSWENGNSIYSWLALAAAIFVIFGIALLSRIPERLHKWVQNG